MTLANGQLWMLAHLAIKFPAAAVLAVGTYVGVSYFDQNPTIAITFDDGRNSVAEIALPYMQQKGVVGTVYLNTDMFYAADYVDADVVSEFAAAGWEIGSHGVSHVDHTTLTTKQLEQSLVESKQVLSTLSGQVVSSFASPYGAYNDDTIAAIKTVYDNHVGAFNGWTDSIGVNSPGTDVHKISRIDITEEVTAQMVCSRVEALDSDDTYVVLFHNITDVPGKYNTTVDKFEDIVDCLVEAGVDVTTVTEAVKAMVSK